MRLKIRNFAKILQADIEIDGITIIAGNNNIGKSTIGKILDAVFNATYNIDEKMKKARISSLAGRLRNDIENSKDKMQTYRRQLSGRHYQEFAANLLDNEKERQEDICKEFEKKLFPADEDQETNFAQMVHERLEENEQISDKTFSKAIYTSYFSEVFHEQINSIFVPDRSAEIELTIKEKKIG